MNERNIKGRSVQGRIGGVLAIMKHHPMFAGQDYSWFKSLIDSIPLSATALRCEARKLVRSTRL